MYGKLNDAAVLFMVEHTTFHHTTAVPHESIAFVFSFFYLASRCPTERPMKKRLILEKGRKLIG